MRLIRSKGVGIFFVTQNPTDVPDSVLGQLGNRVQHALRAFTPDDAAALAKAVKTYPKTKDYDLSEALTQLGTGEAVVTVLAESGAPTPVAWTRLRAPRSWMAQIDPAAQQQAVAGSPLQARYGQSLDRESAYERLTAKLAAPPAEEPEAPADCGARRHTPRPPLEPAPAGWLRGRAGGLFGAVLGSFARSAGSTLGREITRDLFGTAPRRRRTRRR